MKRPGHKANVAHAQLHSAAILTQNCRYLLKCGPWYCLRVEQVSPPIYYTKWYDLRLLNCVTVILKSKSLCSKRATVGRKYCNLIRRYPMLGSVWSTWGDWSPNRKLILPATRSLSLGGGTFVFYMEIKDRVPFILIPLYTFLEKSDTFPQNMCMGCSNGSQKSIGLSRLCKVERRFLCFFPPDLQNH